MSFAQRLWVEIGIHPIHILGIILASTVLYGAFTAVLRLWGQRLYANRSGTGVAVVLVLGAVIGRSMLGQEVTLVGGLICLAWLIGLESIFGAVGSSGFLGHRQAVVLYAQGVLDHRMMRRYHVDERVIWSKLRHAGIGSLAEVQVMILETDGTVSLIRNGVEIDPRLLRSVRGADRVLA